MQHCSTMCPCMYQQRTLSPHFQDLFASYNCSCPEGFNGINCDQEEGECMGSYVGIAMWETSIVSYMKLMFTVQKRHRHYTSLCFETVCSNFWDTAGASDWWSGGRDAVTCYHCGHPDCGYMDVCQTEKCCFEGSVNMQPHHGSIVSVHHLISHRPPPTPGRH